MPLFANYKNNNHFLKPFTAVSRMLMMIKDGPNTEPIPLVQQFQSMNPLPNTIIVNIVSLFLNNGLILKRCYHF